jgi:hypothetical protein
VEVFDPASTRVILFSFFFFFFFFFLFFFRVLSYSVLYLLGVPNRGHRVEQFIPPLSRNRHLRCAGNVCLRFSGDIYLESRHHGYVVKISVKIQSNGAFRVVMGTSSVMPAKQMGMLQHSGRTSQYFEVPCQYYHGGIQQ